MYLFKNTDKVVINGKVPDYHCFWEKGMPFFYAHLWPERWFEERCVDKDLIEPYTGQCRAGLMAPESIDDIAPDWKTELFGEDISEDDHNKFMNWTAPVSDEGETE